MSSFKKNNGNGIIFIHSIFRSGSTYIFSKFREKEEIYTCYQEPVHEIGVMASGEHDLLNQDMGSEKNNKLRHPILNRSYFHELYNIAHKALPCLKKEDIYNNYFDNNVSSLCKYLTTLEENSTHRCVIQECRLTSRMPAIKELVGGTHLYLWRNPWDQWWSYKVVDYFDAVNLLIVTSEKAPQIFNGIIKKINIPKFNNDNPLKELEFYKNIKLTAEEGYLIFYTIWLLSLIDAVKHADLIFNIDKLSISDDYREFVSNEFNNRGIEFFDFSDCDIPTAKFGNKDIEFFSTIESSVHDLFFQSGYEDSLLKKTLSLRHEYSPEKILRNKKLSTDEIIKDSERAREVARDFITDLSSFRHKLEYESYINKKLILQIEQEKNQVELEKHQAKAKVRKLEARAIWDEVKANGVEARIHELEVRVNAAEVKANVAEAHAKEVGAWAQEVEARAHEVEARASVAEARANVAEAKVCEVEVKICEANTRVSALLQSSSWRITQPFRALTSTRSLAFSKCKSLCVKVTRKLIQYPIRFIIKHPKLKSAVLKMTRKYAILERLTRVVYTGNTEASVVDAGVIILTDRGNDILNEIKRAKQL